MYVLEYNHFITSVIDSNLKNCNLKILAIKLSFSIINLLVNIFYISIYLNIVDNFTLINPNFSVLTLQF
jgi:hypothetical protein